MIALISGMLLMSSAMAVPSRYSVLDEVPVGGFGIATSLGGEQKLLIKSNSDVDGNVPIARRHADVTHEVPVVRPDEADSNSPAVNSVASHHEPDNSPGIERSSPEEASNNSPHQEEPEKAKHQEPAEVSPIIARDHHVVHDHQEPEKEPQVLASSTTTKPAPVSEPRRAKAVLSGPSAHGEIIFDQAGPSEPVRITGEVKNLTQGLHGFHIHVYGDVGRNCAAAAGHFNPHQLKHGAPSANERHIGDLGNIRADETGVARVESLDPLVTLFGDHSVLGRGVVVHAGEDDLGLGGDEGSATTGNAGGRVACGVIGIVDPVVVKTN
ncbi:unnamed protein product [Notodromas monacha]|uniref:Superoxide dismutase [Cu-Zn] n=1 Tax=Notodromas monacha TaxID=399045 RepID=A0A7R9GAV4_9CRUS|nr:unnamed protein product [Notodromas monacha]CAG0914389.1 unnamed protein product [Notodromas monacha]